jgi:anion-transporting  ArsA/GET3 family ATPase
VTRLDRTTRGKWTALPPPLERDLVFVTGKGGVGKTTVAAALALAAAAAGRETIVCEIGGQTRVGDLFATPWPRSAALDPGGRASAVALDPDAALREWVSRTGGRAAGALLSQSDTFRYLVAAAPGARELVTMGKAWDLTPGRPGGGQGDRLVVVDGPASGHAIGLLHAPASYAAMARVGPIGRQAGAVRDFLGDPGRCAILLVCTLAEMPVAETVELAAGIERTTGRSADAVVVDQVLPDRFSAREIARIDRLLGASGDPGLRVAARVARQAWQRAREQAAQRSHLREQVGLPVVELPFLFVAALGPAEVAALAGELGPALG